MDLYLISSIKISMLRSGFHEVCSCVPGIDTTHSVSWQCSPLLLWIDCSRVKSALTAGLSIMHIYLVILTHNQRQAVSFNLR